MRDPETMCTVYLLHVVVGTEECLKIGITTHSIAFRYRESKYSHITFRTLYEKLFPVRAAVVLEEDIKRRFRVMMVNPRYMPDGRTECFSIRALLEICEFLDDVTQ
jgi:hypothetical protein